MVIHTKPKQFVVTRCTLVGDLLKHLNDLNVELQGKGQFIYNFYDKIQGFEHKLKLWKQHLLRNNETHFPHLEKENFTTSQKYAKYIGILINEFQIRFHMLGKLRRQRYPGKYFPPHLIWIYSSRRLSNRSD